VTEPKLRAQSFSTHFPPDASILHMEISPIPVLLGTNPSLPKDRRILARQLTADNGTSHRIGERGAAHLKAIIWTAILLLFIYVCAMTVPVYYNEYSFQDNLQNIARSASVYRKSNEQIKQSVLDEAQHEDLPVTAEHIKVEGVAGNVHINVDYSQTIDLKFYQWTVDFHPAVSNSAML
jgi:hypothetical protein